VTGSAPLLGLRGIEVVAGSRTILAVEDLTVAAGETLGILGANGAGKSTLLRVAGGLRAPTRGTLLLDGRPASAAEVRRVTAAVLQRPMLRRRATVQANVETGLRFARVPRAERRRRAGEWIARLGLAGVARQRAATLSGGEAQRVSLARALVLAPRLLLLDEPFTGLDAPTRAELLADLREVLAATGATALFVSHDRHEAAAIADRLAILHGGTLRQLGEPADVLDHPADADCARLLGFENVLAPGVAARVLDRAPNGPVAVRAADLRLVPGGGAAVVERVLPFGGRTRVLASLHGARLVSDAPETGVAPGDPVAVRVADGAARLIASG
jgi:ABC-type sulfate/molybdate transport systems ATPase subunit